MDLKTLKKREPIIDMNEYSFTVYGAPSIGKTSTCYYLFDEPLFFAFEKGQNALNTYVIDMTSWSDVLEFIKQAKKMKKENEKFPFKCIIVDTVDIMRDKCEEYICRLNGWETPADSEYGAGWAVVRREFEKRITDIENLGLKVHFIAHDKVQNIKRKDMEYDKITLHLGSTAVNQVIKKVDFILYFDKEFKKDENGEITTKRVIRFDGGENFEAKARVTGFPPYIYAGDTAEETAKLLKNLFNEKAREMLNYKEEKKKEIDKEIEEKKESSIAPAQQHIKQLTETINSLLRDNKLTVQEVNKIVKENTSVELINQIPTVEEFEKVKKVIEQLH